MQFSVVALFTLMALAIAAPVAVPERLDDLVARSPAPQVSSEDAAMSDASGNVVAFNSASVFQDATSKGQ